MKNRGITLIEALVSLAILGMAVTGIFSAFSNGNALVVLDRQTYLSATILDQARSMTLGSKDNSEYGVHFEEERVILFKGDTFSPADSGNVVIDLDNLTRISNINLVGGGADVVFRRLTGETDNWGTITFSNINDPASTREITIHKTGLTEVNYE